ncbi:hypothetical protein [Bradyrhizobium sp. Leo121]|uniref:hypothetical protein n=1 Tax=Bradyrhizobium sp. Leo121 TaxID=1571195 RepID=UPI0010288433|nr:hypothetical protein [Bradyrhizobium sp. Leo121]
MQLMKAFYDMRQRHFRDLKVQWDIEWQGSYWLFQNFRNWSRTKGSGAVALSEVCHLADRAGATIVLWSSVERLHVYYESFGFKRESDRPDRHGVMRFRREPDLASPPHRLNAAVRWPRHHLRSHRLE